MKFPKRISQASLSAGAHDKSRITEEPREGKPTCTVLEPGREGRPSWLRQRMVETGREAPRPVPTQRGRPTA